MYRFVLFSLALLFVSCSAVVDTSTPPYHVSVAFSAACGRTGEVLYVIFDDGRVAGTARPGGVFNTNTGASGDYFVTCVRGSPGQWTDTVIALHGRAWSDTTIAVDCR